MRAYIRIDPNLADRKAEYPDGAYRAFMDTLCFAEQQHPRGRFRNRRLLAVLLDKRAKWITYLLEHGDLRETESGKLYIDGWDEWQEGDVTVSERMRRLRSRRKDVTPTDTPPVTEPTVTRPSSGSGRRLAESGDAAPSRAANGSSEPPTSFMGFRQKPSSHDGQHPNCAVCEPLRRPKGATA